VNKATDNPSTARSNKANSKTFGNGRAGSSDGDDGIVARTARFADRIIQLCLSLPNHTVGWKIGRQLVRAGMSVGANVEEAQAAESKADFVHKLRIARKEVREVRFFLERIGKAELVRPSRLTAISTEADRILRRLTAIILGSTAEQGRGPKESADRLALHEIGEQP